MEVRLPARAALLRAAQTCVKNVSSVPAWRYRPGQVLPRGRASAMMPSLSPFCACLLPHSQARVPRCTAQIVVVQHAGWLCTPYCIKIIISILLRNWSLPTGQALAFDHRHVHVCHSLLSECQRLSIQTYCLFEHVDNSDAGYTQLVDALQCIQMYVPNASFLLWLSCVWTSKGH